VRTAITALWLVALGAAAWGQHSWENLPYRFSPLVQGGSGEMLAFPPAADLRGWDPEGDVSLVEVGGRAAIRLGPAREGSHIMVSAPSRPNTLYVLRYEYRLSPDVRLPRDPTTAALSGWLTPRPAKTGAVELSGSDERPDGWHPVEAHLFTPSGNERVSVTLTLAAEAGSALVSSVSLREEEIPASGGRMLLTAGDRTWAEVVRHPEPGTQPNGPVLFSRRDPDGLFWYSRPTPEEVGQAIERSACPGEVLTGAVGLSVTSPLRDGRISVSDLRTAKDAMIPASACEGRAIGYLPRRSDYYGRGNTWRWVADSYLPSGRSVPVTAGSTAGFVYRIRVPEDAAPGVYEGTLRAEGEGLPDLTLPIRITVRSFRLVEPRDATWALYSDFGRWREMTDSQVLAEMTDLREHGITALTMPCRGEATLDGTTVTAWQPDKECLRALRLAREAGLAGPHLLQLGKEIDRLFEALRVPESTVAGPPSSWPPVLAEATRSLFAAVNEWYQGAGAGEAVFVGVDEPGYWKEGSPELFAWQYAAASEAGIATYCTSSYLPDDPLGRLLTYHCYGGWLGSRQRAEQRVSESRAAGQHPWYYAVGCYPGQVGNQVRNRYAAGFAFFAARADGQAIWTLERPRGNAFDDFSGETGQPCIILPDPDDPSSSLDTSQWEGIRQAWYDYRYALTLEDAVRRWEVRAEAMPPAVEEAKRLLTEIREGLPWTTEAFTSGEVTSAGCDDLRERIARAVEALSTR
jgi:hypothetical protein